MAALRMLFLALGVVSVVARTQHGNHKYRHAHTYLQICANSTHTYSYGCINKVSAVWPQPARMDPPDCESVGESEPASECTNALQTGNSETAINIYEPITIRQALQVGSYTKGADVDTFTDWDRISCRDGELFATGWYMKYTPVECARLCAKINNFYGKSCTHFSRQWITSDKPTHNDNCGRDGDPVPKGTPAQGAHASAGTGSGKYKYRGQCLFFSSQNKDCCATKAYWRHDGANTDSNYCQAKYGNRKDNWDNKHRSWRHKFGGGAFVSQGAWPVTSLGRRLTSTRPANATGDEPFVHQFTAPNGSVFWAVEDEYYVVAAPAVLTEPSNVNDVEAAVGMARQLSEAGAWLSDATMPFLSALWESVEVGWHYLTR